METNVRDNDDNDDNNNNNKKRHRNERKHKEKPTSDEFSRISANNLDVSTSLKALQLM